MHKQESSISKRTFLAALVLTAIISSTTVYAGFRLSQRLVMHKDMTLRDNYFLVFERFSGREEMAVGNVITNIGENITGIYHFSNISSLLDLAVGNASGTLQTKTALDAVYNDPTDGSYVTATLSSWWFNSGDIARNLTYQWTFEESIRLDAAAAYISNNTYAYSIANFAGGAEDFVSGENLTVRIVYTFDAND